VHGFEPQDDHVCAEYLAYPTLAELIEACEYKFISIENEKGYDRVATLNLDATKRCYSASPEEAVARLWLVINAKQ
jgi:hypothetical protein